MNEERCLKLVNNAITNFNLNLSELIILTEAATGYYQLTPLIAALADAKKVYALTKDSIYGTADSISRNTLDLAERWGLNNIEVLFNRNDPKIQEANIVTNLGFVRPLNANFLKSLNKNAVIPLMFETWEYRPEDVDLAECRTLNIPILGTNENHPSLNIFKYVGYLVLKLLFEINIEVYQSKILVIGGGEFGKATVNTLSAVGANVSQIKPLQGESLNSRDSHKILTDCDAIVCVEHEDRRVLIGKNGQITAHELKLLNSSIFLIHIAGNIDEIELKNANIPFCPRSIKRVGYMSVTTDYLGPRPLIDLHTAGLKVGEIMARYCLEGKGGKIAELMTLESTTLAQAFKD